MISKPPTSKECATWTNFEYEKLDSLLRSFCFDSPCRRRRCCRRWRCCRCRRCCRPRCCCRCRGFEVGFELRRAVAGTEEQYLLVSFNPKLYLTSFKPPTTHPSLVSCRLSSHWSWMLYLITFHDLRNYRASFYILPSNSITHWVAALLCMVIGAQCKELGRWTGRRSSPMQHIHPAKGRGGKKEQYWAVTLSSSLQYNWQTSITPN